MSLWQIARQIDKLQLDIKYNKNFMNAGSTV